MNFTQTYLDDNGYDYFGNAAEDTLMFFVYDESSSPSEEGSDKSGEAITNLSNDTVNGISGGLSSETAAANTETHATAYQENGKDTSTNFMIGHSNAPADNEYSDASVSGLAASPDPDTDADDLSDSVPKMTETDPKQTDTEHSTDAHFKL